MIKIHLKKSENNLCGLSGLGVPAESRELITCKKCKSHPKFPLYSLTKADAIKLQNFVLKGIQVSISNCPNFQKSRTSDFCSQCKNLTPNRFRKCKVIHLVNFDSIYAEDSPLMSVCSLPIKNGEFTTDKTKVTCRKCQKSRIYKREEETLNLTPAEVKKWIQILQSDF